MRKSVYLLRLSTLFPSSSISIIHVIANCKQMGGLTVLLSTNAMIALLIGMKTYSIMQHKQNRHVGCTGWF